jgi:hypothetical protein
MKQVIIFLALVGLYFNPLKAQILITKDGTIEIFSQTSLFTIEAKNQKVASILNLETGDVVASTLVRSFKFKEALVEEHFNENYMQSEKYPKSQFKEKITNFNTGDQSKDGSYEKYGDKVIQIKGAVENITLNENSASIVFIDEMGGVNCVFDSLSMVKNLEKLKKINVGDSIELKGQCDGYDMIMGVVLSRCVLL